jgi:predicted S18 family serine protease
MLSLVLSEDFPMDKVREKELFSSGRARMIEEFTKEYKETLAKVEKIQKRIEKLKQDELIYTAELADVDARVKRAKEAKEAKGPKTEEKAEAMDVDEGKSKKKFCKKRKSEFHLSSFFE